MKKEKVILSFIAALIGLLVASVAFYLYQGTKTVPVPKIKTTSQETPTPNLKSIFLTIDAPSDEAVVDKKILKISGKTEPDATVVILTPTDQQVISPAENGSFTTSVTLDDGENPIEITAIAGNGEETKVIRTVTFSTETF